jgi:N-acylneuraminate cytidylyltransferase
MNDVLAIVPARGGSRSLAHKNRRPLAGHPLLAWAIAAGQQAACAPRVLVSTDDPELRAIALAYGAEAPFLRPAELARDETRDHPVVLHALEWLAREQGYEPELVVQLRPTSPLRPRGLVDAGVARLRAEPAADALRAVAASRENPYKSWRQDGPWLRALAAADLPDVHEPYNAPRQALPATFWQTGQLDIARGATVRAGSLTGTRLLPLLVDARHAVDIDSLEQWPAAERLAASDPELVRPLGAAHGGFGHVRLLVCDFDGVFTDDRVYVLEDGREAVACQRGDGLGVARLRRAGVRVEVLSSETNPVVRARCRKLGIACQQGVADKLPVLRALAEEAGLTLREVAYVGNDVNDLECLRAAGLGVAVADARPELRAEADWVLAARGGAGAVRELCELIIDARARQIQEGPPALVAALP